MSKMIQIRNVPDDLHAAITARAADAGMTLSAFLLREVERVIATPPVNALLARRAARGRPQVAESPAHAVRAERATR